MGFFTQNPDIFVFIFLLVGLGASGGLLAGLLGIGGGIIFVPGIYYVMQGLGIETDKLIHIAIGTSLAMIVPTGLLSARNHWRYGNMRKDLLIKLLPAIIVGTLLGAVFADFISGLFLKLIFASALFLIAIYMLISAFKKRSLLEHPEKLKHHHIAGFGVGFMSALMGIGGATLSVPYMSACGIKVHQAIGTAAAIGVGIALPGALGFLIAGLNEASLPPFSAGYIYLPILILTLPFCMICVPIGARLSRALAADKMKNIFAFFVMIVAIRMIADVFQQIL
jgi:uncharacterized membrane protein YfcA